MLQALNAVVRSRVPFGAAPAALRRIEAAIDVSPEQRPAWLRFVAAFEEARDAIDEIDALADDAMAESAPALHAAMQREAQGYAARMFAARMLANAAAELSWVLTPVQRTRADRLLEGPCRELIGGVAGRRR